MAEGFKIASAYAEVKGEVDETSVRSAGVRAGTAMAEEAERTADKRKGGFLSRLFSVSGIGPHLKRFGAAIDNGLSSSFKEIGGFSRYVSQGISGAVSAIQSVPWAGIGIAVAVALATPIAAAFAVGVVPAAFIGLGAFILKNNKTIVSSFEAMKTRIGNAFKGVADPLIKPFTAGMKSIGDSAQRVAPLLKQIFTAIAPAVGPLVKGITGFAENFLKVLTADPKTMQSMTDALKAIGDHLPAIGTALGKFFATLAANKNTVNIIGVAFSILGNAIQVLGYVLSYAMDSFMTAVVMWHALQDAIMVAVNWITGTAWPAIKGFFEGIGKWFSDLPGKIGGAFTAIGTWFSNLGTTIGNWFTSVGKWFADLPGKIGAFLAGLPGKLGSLFTQALDAALYAIGFGIGAALKFFMDLPGKISNFIQSIPGKLQSLFTSAWNLAKNAVSTGVSATLKFFSDLPGKASSALSSLWSKISGAFSSAVSGAKDKSSELVSGAINVIGGLPGKVASALSSIKSKVTGAFSGAASWLTSAGSDMIHGIISGIGNAIGGAVDAAKHAASKIVQGFKDALKISSPSRVMADEVGHWIPEGVAVGIQKNMKAVQAPMSDIPDALTQPMTTAATSGGGSIGGPTYHFAAGSIVLDASKLKSIQDLMNMLNSIVPTARQVAGAGVRF